MNKKVIKSKIKSTQNIKKITKTMEMVSVAKMRKAVQMADDYKTFGNEAKKILNLLADQREKSKYSTSNSSNKRLIIIIAGQKGLCGGYNSNIFRYISRNYSEDIKNKNIYFITIGKYAEKIARRFDQGEAGSSILLSFNGKEFLSKDARVVTKNISESFLKEEYKEIDLIYTDFENVNSQVVTTAQLLPFKPTNIEELKKEENFKVNHSKNSPERNKEGRYKDLSQHESNLEYVFEPSTTLVYDYTVRILLQNIISGSVLRARAAEHAARMMAMKTATDNASEMIHELKLWYNKARQAAITQEIAEISSAMIVK